MNILDLVLVASNLGQTGQNAGDVNGDGVVNILDSCQGCRRARQRCRRAFTASTSTGNAHRRRRPRLAHSSTALKLTDATSQRGILFLEQLLAALIPKETALLPNYPNPFNPETWIPYQLAESAEVTLTIYDMNGQLVQRLEVGHQAVGMYQSRSRAVYWDGRNQLGESVASGLYFYTLTTGDFTATRRMLILEVKLVHYVAAILY